jgi:hypothetical protein
LQSGVSLLHKLSGLAEAPLGNPLTDLPVIIIRLMSSRFQIVQGTGHRLGKDLTPVDQKADKLGGNFTVIPVSPSTLKIRQGKEGSNRSLKGCEIGSTDARIITTGFQITFCSSQIALRFGKIVLPHITLFDARSDGEI